MDTGRGFRRDHTDTGDAAAFTGITQTPGKGRKCLP